MTTATITPPRSETVADLLESLGGISPKRVRLSPVPGSATEADLLARPGGEKRLYELVDGTLVEKPMGYYEAIVAAVMIGFLRDFLRQHRLGFVMGADAPLRLGPSIVRLPDVSFVSWDRFPDRQLPREPVPDMAPDLAVEVLSEGNTDEEMGRKLREYFGAGTRLVWYVEPDTRCVSVYTSPTDVRLLGEADTLDGGAVLPGFRLSIRDLFDEAGTRRDP